MSTEYISKAVAAVELNCSTATVERRVKEGKLKAYQDDQDRRRLRYLRRDIERLKIPRPKS